MFSFCFPFFLIESFIYCFLADYQNFLLNFIFGNVTQFNVKPWTRWSEYTYLYQMKMLGDYFLRTNSRARPFPYPVRIYCILSWSLSFLNEQFIFLINIFKKLLMVVLFLLLLWGKIKWTCRTFFFKFKSGCIKLLERFFFFLGVPWKGRKECCPIWLHLLEWLVMNFYGKFLLSPRKDETLLELFSFLAVKSSPSLDPASIVDLKGQVWY